ncbi:hypothetical protein HPB47_015817 [Ixodes persulcatus]|uniref:Uncharacterized protein n=1 Tax=Ixodes persulcatus TaxID=34615 RepID=A0AC60R167_IXOPE|nr:hypothetical protein HPB47_015817 [Ixodes persulcatus]
MFSTADKLWLISAVLLEESSATGVSSGALFPPQGFSGHRLVVIKYIYTLVLDFDCQPDHPVLTVDDVVSRAGKGVQHPVNRYRECIVTTGLRFQWKSY